MSHWPTYNKVSSIDAPGDGRYPVLLDVLPDILKVTSHSNLKEYLHRHLGLITGYVISIPANNLVVTGFSASPALQCSGKDCHGSACEFTRFWIYLKALFILQ